MRGSFLVLSMLIATAFLPAASAAITLTGPPQATVGDFWDTTGSFGTQGFTSTTTSHSAVDGFETLTVDGASTDAVRTIAHSVTSTSGGTGGYTFNSTTTSDTTAWARASDGASIKSETT
ncbi:MAG: hypothetical protein ACYDCK_04225, partial [Thermoplasmatota archaeon]